MLEIVCACGEKITVADDVSIAELVRTISRLDAEFSRSFVRIESKLDRVTDDHESRLRDLERVDVGRMGTDLENRLRIVEKWMWGLGATGTSTGIFALLLQFIGSK